MLQSILMLPKQYKKLKLKTMVDNFLHVFDTELRGMNILSFLPQEVALILLFFS